MNGKALLIGVFLLVATCLSQHAFAETATKIASWQVKEPTAFAVLGLVLSGNSVAAQSSASTAEHFTAGIVLAVDAENRALAIEEAGVEGRHFTFIVPTDAHLSDGEQVVELPAIRIGDPVSVEYDRDGTKLVARHVKLIGTQTS